MKDNPSKNREQLEISPSKNRRRKGDGNGFIYWRTITKKGKDYQQAYYHWKENGQKKTRYIPKKLLGDIQEAEAAKLPVQEILLLLGISVTPSNQSPSNLLGDIQLSPSNSDISPSNNSPSNLLGDIQLSPSNSGISPSNNSPSNLLGDIQLSPSNSGISPSNNSPSNLLGDIPLSSSNSDISPSNNSPSNLLGDIQLSPSNSGISPSNNSPSKMRRHKGEGSGNIHWRTITKKGKDYPQAYYHFEFWTQGDRLVKSSKYIPKRLIHRVEQLEQEKAPVKEILQVLGVEL
ncbi:hypothetical protein [Trichormus sp. NMC-1]|uniref:hypothetical protein n=1 Tax=Trichormus sp. NMC-1 TaxID=1853259 RepID=UPI0008DBEC58|nr:hypothetical protein [Trichormus sp. NMC-1]